MRFVIAAIIIFAIGWAFSPLAVAIWFIATHSISEIIKAFLILYIIAIPISIFAQPRY